MALTVLEKLEMVGKLRVPHLLYDSCVGAFAPPEVMGRLMRCTACVPMTSFWRVEPGYSERSVVEANLAERVKWLQKAGGAAVECTLAVVWNAFQFPLPDSINPVGPNGSHKFPTGDEGRWVKPLLHLQRLARTYGFREIAFLCDVERYKAFDGSGPQPVWMLEAADLALASAFPRCAIHRYGCLGRTDPEQDGVYEDSTYFPAGAAYAGPNAVRNANGLPAGSDAGPAEINTYYGGDTDRVRAAIRETRRSVPRGTPVWVTLTCSLRGDRTGLHWGQVDWPLREQFLQGGLLGLGAAFDGADGLIEWKYSGDANPLRWCDYLATRLCGVAQSGTEQLFDPAKAWM